MVFASYNLLNATGRKCIHARWLAAHTKIRVGAFHHDKGSLQATSDSALSFAPMSPSGILNTIPQDVDNGIVECKGPEYWIIANLILICITLLRESNLLSVYPVTSSILGAWCL